MSDRQYREIKKTKRGLLINGDFVMMDYDKVVVSISKLDNSKFRLNKSLNTLPDPYQQDRGTLIQDDKIKALVSALESIQLVGMRTNGSTSPLKYLTTMKVIATKALLEFNNEV